jgi:hypothetical protein
MSWPLNFHMVLTESSNTAIVTEAGVYTYDKSGKLIGFAKPNDLAGKHAEAIKAATGTLEDTAAASGVERQRMSAKESLSKSVDALVAEIESLARSVPSIKLNPQPEPPIIARTGNKLCVVVVKR